MNFPSLESEQQLDALQGEWRALIWAKEKVHPMLPQKVPAFWHNLRTAMDGNGESKFSLLSHFMYGLLVLPNSSECVERIFTQLTLVKTKQASSLKNRSVAGRLPAKESVTRQNAKCFSWKPLKCVIEDVKNGRCYRRYKDSFSEQPTVTL